MPVLVALPVLAGLGAGALLGGGTILGLSAMTSAIVVGALAGAVVGGITAAVTGGDILEGVLFGAVGGAVGGALGGLFTGATFGSTGVTVGETTAVVGAGGTPTAEGAALAFGGEAGLGADVGLIEAGIAGVTEGSGGIGAILGELTAAEKLAGVTAVGGLLEGFGDEDDLTAYEREQAALTREKMEADRQMLEMQLSKETPMPANYTREVAAINAASAKEIALQKSADLATQIADAKAARTKGYLREDEARARARETAGGVLISRKRIDAPTPPVEEATPSPQTPRYIG